MIIGEQTEDDKIDHAKSIGNQSNRCEHINKYHRYWKSRQGPDEWDRTKVLAVVVHTEPAN